MVKPSGCLSYNAIYRYDGKGPFIEIIGYDGEIRITDRQVIGFTGDDALHLNLLYYSSDG